MKKRAKSGTKALRDIRKWQKNTEPLLPKTVIARIVKQMCQVYDPITKAGIFARGCEDALMELRWTRLALQVLQVSGLQLVVPAPTKHCHTMPCCLLCTWKHGLLDVA